MGWLATETEVHHEAVSGPRHCTRWRSKPCLRQFQEFTRANRIPNGGRGVGITGVAHAVPGLPRANTLPSGDALPCVPGARYVSDVPHMPCLPDLSRACHLP